MPKDTSVTTADRSNPQIAVVIFGIGISVLVLYLLMFAINLRGENDFYKEAWPAYQLLDHGHILAFLRDGPGYVGSLILRAPIALLVALFGAGARATYVATALPCVVAPALLAAWLAPHRHRKPGAATTGTSSRIRPLDLFMFAPPAFICVIAGHPEDILGAALCVAAVLLAQRGSAQAAGVMLGLALINKSWAIIAAPLVFAVMPADRRLRSFGTAVVVTAVVMVPVLAIRMTGSSASGGATGLGSSTGGIFLVPQLLWFFGRNSWVAREGHIILVAIGWIVTAGWWWFRVRGQQVRPGPGTALIMLALVFFLRAALDPWDDLYYFAPFMLTIMAYEDAQGFPMLTWAFGILLVVIVPPSGLLHGLGDNGHAAAFAVFALASIAYLARRAVVLERPASGRLYAAVSRSPT
jgi:hypothetical protein